MKKIRSRRFYKTFFAVACFSALFLGCLYWFSGQLAERYFTLLTYSVFSVMALSTASFLAICFAPYFRGDRRWFAIPALLTVVFFAGVMLLWQLPIPGGAIV
ncbi:MAG: hypothetical protein IKC31_05485 [Clostridia bacterium]|nr:hypothetical protein [Clostridia bacterium]